MKVLVTGATGYIGGRLIPLLLERGIEVRALVRNPKNVIGRPWVDGVEVFPGDLLDPGSLDGAFEGVDTAYYLVHSMYSGKEFAQRDQRAAVNFCMGGQHLSHVIYLGGLLPPLSARRSGRLSRHLESRLETGAVLSRNFPTTELRAGPIIGSGSASFEMLRYLTERIPVMAAPRWVNNFIQPIAIRDVLSYLVLALERGPSGVVEIGSEVMTYKKMMLGYARARGLKRLIVPLPAVLPAFAGAGWVGFVTPIPITLATPLIESMAESLKIRRGRAQEVFPEITPISYDEALHRALRCVEEGTVETRWSGAMSSDPYDYSDSEGLMREVRTIDIKAPPEMVFEMLSGIGGNRGWWSWNWAWWTRGLIDRLVGGVGLRRGRRHPDNILPGEAIDFWRVEAVEQGRLLRLRAEWKLPGHAWLQWEVSKHDGSTRLVQTAAFAPLGLPGVLYWYGLYPLHKLVFVGLVRAIGRQVKRRQQIVRLARLRAGVQSAPPGRHRSVFGDIKAFLLERPVVPTLIEFESTEERENYRERIIQRIGVDVSNYSVLNLHKIGVNVPIKYVYEEAIRWDGHSSCWPSRLATAERIDGKLEEIKIRPMGLRRIPFGNHAKLGWKIKSLFDLTAIKVQHVPSMSDPDNARYMLYSCSGGYPIGIFLLYARSSIREQGEEEMTQVFLGVGFNFYGKETLSRFRPLSKIWEAIHNRVTANVLNRFKQLCEWRFAKIRINA